MKYSAARREDYVNIVSVTEITAHFLLRHCTARWLSLDKVLVRIIEQYGNLKEHFLKTLPKLPGFRGNNGVEQTERYQRIKSNLNNPGALAYMSFVVYIAQAFKNIVLPLQAEEPKIHIFNTKCTQLVKDILSKFIDQEIYLQSSCGRLSVKSKLLDAAKDETKYNATPKFYSFFMYPGSCNHCYRSDASCW